MCFKNIRLHLEITGDGNEVELIRARFTNEDFDTLVNLRLDLEPWEMISRQLILKEAK